MERASDAGGSADPVSPDGPDGLSLASTLCARLCHDLAGTVGALAAALAMTGKDGDPEALSLASDCAQELADRLRLLRSAWSADEEAPEPACLVAGLPGIERLQVDLSGLPVTLAEAPRRLSPNLLLLAAQSLPRGGSIRLAGEDGGLSLEIAGPRAGWPAVLGQCLDQPEGLQSAAASPRDVAVAITCLRAERLGLRIALDGPTRLVAR